MLRRFPNVSRENFTRDVNEVAHDVSRDGMLSPASAQRELSVRGEILNVPADKIPAVASVFDFSVMKEVVEELHASGWKPTR
jgi:hypothetical protein